MQNLHRECVGRDRMERFPTSPLDAQSNSATGEDHHSFSISFPSPFGFSFLFPFLLQFVFYLPQCFRFYVLFRFQFLFPVMFPFPCSFIFGLLFHFIVNVPFDFPLYCDFLSIILYMLLPAPPPRDRRHSLLEIRHAFVAKRPKCAPFSTQILDKRQVL